MAINLSRRELELLDKADNDIAKKGFTDEKCPRCGNGIIVEETGNSYTIRCNSKGCISLDFRGI